MLLAWSRPCCSSSVSRHNFACEVRATGKRFPLDRIYEVCWRASERRTRRDRTRSSITGLNLVADTIRPHDTAGSNYEGRRNRPRAVIMVYNHHAAGHPSPASRHSTSACKRRAPQRAMEHEVAEPRRALERPRDHHGQGPDHRDLPGQDVGVVLPRQRLLQCNGDQESERETAAVLHEAGQRHL